jgi:predicted RNase H-like HicB family nuclease
VRKVKVIYRAEPDGWWAESLDFSGFTAVGRDYGEVREMVHEGLSQLSNEPLDIVEENLAPDVVKDLATVAWGLSFRLTQGFQSSVFGDPMKLPANDPSAFQV